MNKGLILFLTLAVVLSLTACGGGNKEENTTAPPATAAPEVSKPEAASASASKPTESGKGERVYISGHDNFPSPETLKNVVFDHTDKEYGDLVYMLSNDEDTAIADVQAYLMLLSDCGYDWEATSSDQILQVKRNSKLIAYVAWAMEDGNYILLIRFD